MNIIYSSKEKSTYHSLKSQGENNDSPSLGNGKTNAGRTLKEKLAFSLLEEKLIFSLNSSLKQ